MDSSKFRAVFLCCDVQSVMLKFMQDNKDDVISTAVAMNNLALEKMMPVICSQGKSVVFGNT
jgi:hypothetical protein